MSGSTLRHSWRASTRYTVRLGDCQKSVVQPTFLVNMKVAQVGYAEKWLAIEFMKKEGMDGFRARPHHRRLTTSLFGAARPRITSTAAFRSAPTSDGEATRILMR